MLLPAFFRIALLPHSYGKQRCETSKKIRQMKKYNKSRINRPTKTRLFSIFTNALSVEKRNT
tara:strand:- start:12762 stop:12947 length:186 start_codon:yes stop_codon:yes gene_type:complete